MRQDIRFTLPASQKPANHTKIDSRLCTSDLLLVAVHKSVRYHPGRTDWQASENGLIAAS